MNHTSAEKTVFTIKADIFIPTSNRVDSLKQCLDSLQKQTSTDFRILLVGLKGDVKVTRLLKKYSNLDIIYFLQKDKGLIGAANEALAVSKNEIFVRIDDDVILNPDWYKNLILTYQSDRRIGGVTGPTIMSEKGINSRDLTAFLNNFKTNRNLLLKLVYYVYNNYLYENKMLEVSTFMKSGVFTLGSNHSECLSIEGNQEVDNLEACNWSARRKLLKQINGFDPIYVKGLGDYHEADAALRIKKLGYKLIFNSGVTLRHNVEIGKVAKARPAPFYRIQNFIIFYFRFFKIESLDQLCKFTLNVFLQNCYYLYRFVTTGKISQLGAITGTVVGLSKVVFAPRKYLIVNS